MAAKLVCLCLLLSLNHVVSQVSPAPSPELPAGSPSPSPAPVTGSPLQFPQISPISSPPAPTPSDLSSSPSPGPAPEGPSDTYHSDINANGVGSSSGGGGGGGGGGTSRGKKAGIALGVIFAAGVVVVGALVYKKRRDNVRRSHYTYAARAEIL